MKCGGSIEQLEVKNECMSSFPVFFQGLSRNFEPSKSMNVCIVNDLSKNSFSIAAYQKIKAMEASCQEPAKKSS
jgi:hypothetical protein